MIYLTNEKGEFITTEKNEFIIIKKEKDMNNILRNLGSCDNSYTGSKMNKCNIRTYGTFEGIGFVQAGTDLTGIEKKEVHDKLVKEGKLFPYMGIYNYTVNTPEDVINTSPKGVMSLGRESQPQFVFEYDQGECMNKSLRNKFNGDWDIIIYTNVGIILTQNKSQTKVQGFKLSFNHARHNPTNAEGTEVERTMLTVQFADAGQWNDQKEILLYENTDYALNEIEGAESVTIHTTEVKAGTELTIEITNSCNYDFKVTGLQDKTNFKVNGVNPDSVTQNLSKPGTYTLTLTDALVAGDSALIEVQGTDEIGTMYTGYKKIKSVTA